MPFIAGFVHIIIDHLNEAFPKMTLDGPEVIDKPKLSNVSKMNGTGSDGADSSGESSSESSHVPTTGMSNSNRYQPNPSLTD